MEFGALTTGFLTGLREGVEAALIVSIVLAYVVRTGNGRHVPKIWLGTGAAAAVSLALGLILFTTVGGFEEPYEQVFEGVAMLLAAVVVTWMLFWMRRQSVNLKGELQAAVDRVLTEGTAWGLAVLAFTAVIREGVETALFLTGQATSAEAGASSVLVGALLGIAAAVVIGWGFYTGSRRIDLRSFFRWTGIALIFIAAGLLSHAVHEFIEVGEFYGIEVVGSQTAFDISSVLSHEEGIGQFLRALFGYSASPEVLTLLVHVGYVVAVLALYLRPVRPAPPATRPDPIGA
ncbi:MAG TPA: iron uptake transporter permease EfeU [Candidatus Limnocylindrales bacterium]|nr:iron uptake transporter permease EfeU [Candidatus Limnocylindrales bacterium]